MLKRILLLSNFSVFLAYSANVAFLTITPPPTLFIDGQPIIAGQFKLTGVDAYSDPFGAVVQGILLDQSNPGDDIIINVPIGGA